MEKKFSVIYEDNHLIAVNKPAGLLVQGDATGDEPLVELVRDYIRVKYEKPGKVFCGLIHRIDRPVSGLVLLARTSKGLERMSKLFQAREVKKTYWAVVTTNPESEEGTLTHWLVKDKAKNLVHGYYKPRHGAQKAVLDYKLLGMIGKEYLLEVTPHTGRPHQIRVQLSKMGCPIKGDMKYGSEQKMRGGRIFLHSRRLEFIHPTKKEPVRIEATVPSIDDWRKFKHLA
ncbi:MAG: RluA family pseudouridine synthase [Flammeovirgaceae bacterium]